MNLQLVGSEAGPGPLGRFRLVKLLLGGYGPLHINTAPCNKGPRLVLKHFRILENDEKKQHIGGAIPEIR